MRSRCRGAALLPVILLLAACKEQAPEAPPPIRPVLSVVVDPATERSFGFTGTVEPRYRVSLGFRLLGRLIHRDVEVGDQVRAGTRLAAIDSLALELAVRSAVADMATARAQLANATGVEGRQRILTERNVVATAQLESAQQALASAEASVQRAEANLAKANEQLTYAQLQSDTDGVVTAIGAQVGQVVSPGQAVVTIARPDIREAAVDVPEDVARDLHPGTPFDIALQLDPRIRTQGEVREIGPQADQTTRTRRVLITLSGTAELFRLGTTVTATLRVPAAATITLPRSALLQRDGKDVVWVVDTGTGTVATRDVRVGRRDDAAFVVTAGLAAGDRVVTAGANSLRPGQQVRIPGEPAR
ncbi:efflux RND transporter periplasmic adaptor subunit [Plastoroseomonas hellenica]|uniref:efflux RND transporter periplasmic adaptor subunit n=1 Tax=Plastoroseomonas hellenica TaxID=2687306 RepID=UPI001BA4C80D|nr:efflux RND transporter periplasmic adaptor subunit [Plastoroseomonas hellenica]MBR0643288.1 efflux RND transporter periplasmic adaptor subunit [Plastoroseomonas hellenica]